MTKSTKEQIQKDEQKILAELMKNSKESIDMIAKNCGFSRQKAWRMIKQLKRDQKIWGYTAIVDLEMQDMKKFILSIKRSGQPLDKKSMNEIAYEKLEKIISSLGVTIESSYFIHGEYDWMLIFMAKDIQYAKKFATTLLNAYPGIVSKVDIAQILYTQRDHRVANPDQSKLMEFL